MMKHLPLCNLICVAHATGGSDYNANSQQIWHPDLLAAEQHLGEVVGCRTQSSGSPAENRNWFWIMPLKSLYGIALRAYFHLSSES